MDQTSLGDPADGVWAEPAEFCGNVVTQLLAPAGSDIESRTTVSRARMTVKDVLETYQGALSLDEGGLRRAQLGAVHSVMGYWLTSRTEPATVVMPTGTGKTETMLALLVAARLPRLLVLVPSAHLREQIADKFERLGVLREFGIIRRAAACPAVGRLSHKITDRVVAAGFAEACNVIVATPQVLHLCDEESRGAILTACSHLFVDEAHHVEARTWSYIRSWFTHRQVVQFTATPFREDGRHVAGRQIYSFPLREAQREGHFSTINYVSVLDFDDPDGALAERAITQLRADLDADYDHLLMARAKSINRAQKLAALYQRAAPDLRPVLLYSNMASRRQAEALAAIRSRASRIIVCVNMLGEGFDLPELKVAAIHDPQKSLSVTMQFIGRFARGRPDDPRLGQASAFVTHPDSELDTRLRSLYAEDADWNVLLHNLSEAAVQTEAEVSEFESEFTQLPNDITLRNLMPKLSTVVYKAPTDHWNPDALYDYFGVDKLLTVPIGLNLPARVAWCVVERHEPVRWSDSRILEETGYELFVLYFDAEQRLLYINNSANSGHFEELAEAVLGVGALRFTGSTVYRAMADIDRLVPTNVGVLDARSQFRRFSMHVGPDVSEGIPTAEAQTKTQTHIAGSGYRNGSRVHIAVGIKGRIWSPVAAQSLKQWRDWCDEIGSRLLDKSISIDNIVANFILPEQVQERPPKAVLALEWPWELYQALNETVHIEHNNRRYPILDVDLRPNNQRISGPINFDVATERWTVPYRLDIKDGDLTYECLAPTELVVHGRRFSMTLGEWLNQRGLTVHFEGDQLLQPDGILLRVTGDIDPYPREQLLAIDWVDTDIKVEAQKAEKLGHSIQARMIRNLLAEREWDVILDDDGSGEVADIVAMALTKDRLRVRLVHCKYSSASISGARVGDLYEVCGQAMKSVRWRAAISRFLARLEHRARLKQTRTGVSPWEAGDPRAFRRLRDHARLVRPEFEIVIVQPGLSKIKASKEQLELLAATELHVRQTADASFRVYCNA